MRLGRAAKPVPLEEGAQTLLIAALWLVGERQGEVVQLVLNKAELESLPQHLHLHRHDEDDRVVLRIEGR